MNVLIWIALGESSVLMVLMLVVVLCVWPRPKVRLGGTGFSGEITVSLVASAFRVPSGANPRSLDHVARQSVATKR